MLDTSLSFILRTISEYKSNFKPVISHLKIKRVGQVEVIINYGLFHKMSSRRALSLSVSVEKFGGFMALGWWRDGWGTAFLSTRIWCFNRHDSKLPLTEKNHEAWMENSLTPE